MVFLAFGNYIHLRRKQSQKIVSSHGNHYNYIVSQDMESALSLFLSALCSLRPHVIEWLMEPGNC